MRISGNVARSAPCRVVRTDRRSSLHRLDLAQQQSPNFVVGNVKRIERKFIPVSE
jgi:hypothetical protein